jgi:hypothetical protein
MSTLFGILVVAGIVFLGIKVFSPSKVEKSKHPGNLGPIGGVNTSDDTKKEVPSSDTAF